MSVASTEQAMYVVDENGDVLVSGQWTDEKNPSHVFIPFSFPSAMKNVRQVSAGDEHVAFVTDEALLLLCGRGDYGQLGTGYRRSEQTPQLVLKGVRIVNCGSFHTVALTVDKKVMAFGHGMDGRLGNNGIEDQLLPSLISFDETIVNFACGEAHNVALTESGNLFTWGRGEKGSLGHGNYDSKYTPERIENETAEKFVFICAGGDCTMAITERMELFSWGANGSGCLGHVSKQACELIPRAVLNHKVKKVSCSGTHTLMLDADGEIWAAGMNRKGQLGLGNTRSTSTFQKVTFSTESFQPLQVKACRNDFSAILTRNGLLYTFGNNFSGQLGYDSEDHPSFVPQQVSVSSGLEMGRFGAISKKNAEAFKRCLSDNFCSDCITLILTDNDDIWKLLSNL